MAAYNGWMNRNVYEAAAKLTDAERKADRGAFFGSIHSTLNHILWGDRLWLGRFNGKSYSAGAIRRRSVRRLRPTARSAPAHDDDIRRVGRPSSTTPSSPGR